MHSFTEGILMVEVAHQTNTQNKTFLCHLEMPATVSNRQHVRQAYHHSQSCMNSLEIFWLVYSLTEQAL